MQPELLDEQIHHLGHQSLLLLQRAVRKRMRQTFPHLPVNHGIPLADNGVRLIGKAATVVEAALDKRPVPGPEAIDILPRAGGAEGQLVGRRPHYGAVSLVQRQHPVRLSPTEKPVRVQDVTPRGEERTRESVEGMAHMVPEYPRGEQEQELQQGWLAS